MNWQTFFPAELRKPLCALAFAVGFSVTAVFARILVTQQLRPLFLVWNLFLAVMPLALALTLRHLCRPDVKLSLKLALLAAWLLFFPNAPYIMTDFVHLKSRFHPNFWTDLTLLLLFSWCGALAGFLSLYIVQRLVARGLGNLLSWVFICAVAGLTGVGIYLGRVERWNTWDILIHPLAIVSDALGLCRDAMHRGQPSRIAAFFSVLVFVGYTTLYALMPDRRAGLRSDRDDGNLA
jgi:uncharacterized membrane protein